VIGGLFLLLGAMYLYGTWSDRRKKSPTGEESQPLSNRSKTDSDCEKGVTEHKDADDRVHFSKLSGESVSGASLPMSDPPSYDRPPGLPQGPR